MSLNIEDKYAIKVVKQKINPLFERQKVAFWGIGNVLDILISKGNLKISDINFLIDTKYGDTLHPSYKIRIHQPEILRIYEPNIVIVLSQPEEKIAKRANNFGVRHVLRISELVEQVMI